MNTKNRISAATFLAAASLSFSPAAWSLGLGDITVESFLNQPLQVKIDLVTRETDDLATVTAGLASVDDYELIGASRESISVPIGFTIEDIDGDAYILATSTLPVGNPVMRLIVEVNWSSGRLLREYTVFLDPPVMADAAPIPRIEQRKTPPPVVPQAPKPSTEEGSQARQAQPERVSAEPRQPVDGEYGPVASGDTLWEIAVDWSQGTGLGVNQVMIAIQRENPEAFIKDNINLLKRGAILRMPRVDDVRNISTATANNEVIVQTEEFEGSKVVNSATSPSTPLLAAETAVIEEQQVQPDSVETDSAERVQEVEEVAEDAAGEITQEADEVAEESVAEEPDLSPQLELVPPSEDSELDSAYGFEQSENDGTDASVAVSALREDLARTEEDLITQQQQNEYLAERIQELEAQLESAGKDSVNDTDLANMESRLREERLAEAAADKKTNAPWYSRFSAWLIGLLILAAALGGWLLSRRGGGDEYTSTLGSEDDTLRDIKDEAEEVLRVLDDSDDSTDEPEGEEAPAADEQPAKPKGDSGEAELLDEESSDPEIQLDLARAYISMGDKEAARVILEEVRNNGSEEQRNEAESMLNLLAP